MSAIATLRSLRAAGFDVTTENGAIYVAPKNTLNDSHRAGIIAHKPLLIELLRAEAIQAHIAYERALQDALSAKLGSLEATRATYHATNEIIERWKGIGRDETRAAIQCAALELLCMRNEIDFTGLRSLAKRPESNKSPSE